MPAGEANTEEQDEMMSEDELKTEPQPTAEGLQGEPKPAAEAARGDEQLRAELAAVKEELAKKSAEAAEYLDQWRRSAAELSNARKRMLREQDEVRAMAAHRVLEKLLPIVDDMDRAFAALSEDDAASHWVGGFRAIRHKLQGLLEGEGVVPIETEGQTFDPALHYAITHEEAGGYEEGQIIGEAARGYMLRDRVLRPSMVRVAKGNQVRSNHP
jgi:molecular chaperone GrpE